MSGIGERLRDRHAHNVRLFTKFAVVGLTGVVVNMITLIIVKKLGPHFDEALLAIPLTDFNLRWYHVYSTFAFLVANLSNYQLNRSWAFKSNAHASWLREYLPFLTVGLVGQVAGLALLTMLMHPHSPMALPTTVFDDSSGLRSRLYWGQLIVIMVITPLSFVLNKVWVFSAVRTSHREDAAARRERRTQSQRPH